MRSDMSALAQRSLAGARAAWPLFLATTLLAATLGYQLEKQLSQPLTPQFEFSNGTSTIQASGAWHTSSAPTPNATNIFCWLPANSCDVSVASLVVDGSRERIQLTDKSLDITQLSDTSLTATASSTDPCHVESLHIDRKARTATLSIGPSHKATTCAGTATLTATLGG